jgi:hypothetical protein
MSKDLLPFVNDDENALLFLRYNYIGEDFTKPINRKETRETIKGEAVYQLMLKKNYTAAYAPGDADKLENNFQKMIHNIGYWHKEIDGKPITDLSAQKVYDKVYRRWAELETSARKFYQTHMFLTKSESGVESIITDFNNLAMYEASIKLHLRKAADNVTTTFCKTLPYNVIKEGGISPDYFFNRYKTGFTTAVRFEIYNVASNLSLPKFIANVIKNAGVNVDLYKYAPSSLETLEDLYPEEPKLAQLNFTRDENGVLIRDGELLDDAKLAKNLNEVGMCYGTGIADAGTNCPTVYRCLLDVKPGDISRCAGELENEALFNVPLDTVQKINPRIMKLILDNLGVKLSKKYGATTCESFESWLSRTPIRNVVNKNKNLSRYIKTIINTIRSNSIILNPNQKLGKLYGLSTFKTPVALENKSQNTENLQDLLLYTKNIPIPSALSTPIRPDNIRFFMHGGGEYSENATQIKKLFDVLFVELDNAGVPLVDNDQKRIYDTIDKMSKLELDLPRLLEDLRVYTELIKLIDEKEKDKTELDDFKDILNNKTQLSDLVNKVNKKIQANIIKQNLIFQVLYNRVQVPLITRLGF